MQLESNHHQICLQLISLCPLHDYKMLNAFLFMVDHLKTPILENQTQFSHLRLLLSQEQIVVLVVHLSGHVSVLTKHLKTILIKLISIHHHHYNLSQLIYITIIIETILNHLIHLIHFYNFHQTKLNGYYYKINNQLQDKSKIKIVNLYIVLFPHQVVVLIKI